MTKTKTPEDLRRQRRAETHRGNAAAPQANKRYAHFNPGKGHRNDWKQEVR